MSERLIALADATEDVCTSCRSLRPTDRVEVAMDAYRSARGSASGESGRGEGGEERRG